MGPPIPNKYLHTLFSFLCKASIVVLHVGTTALPNNRDGIAMSFQMAFPTTALSALFFTSFSTVFTFLSALPSNLLFSFSKIFLHLPPMVMPRYVASVTISYSPICSWLSGPFIFMILVFFSLIWRPYLPPELLRQSSSSSKVSKSSATKVASSASHIELSSNFPILYFVFFFRSSMILKVTSLKRRVEIQQPCLITPVTSIWL